MQKSLTDTCRTSARAPRRSGFASAGFFTSGLVLASLLATGGLQAENTSHGGPGGDFASDDLSGWKERSFEGNTRYQLVEEDGFSILKGHSQSSASILYREHRVDLSDTPIITWSWKVDGIFQDIDEQTKAGDDFPARLYVVAKIGILPWDTLALNYVWSSQMPVGEAWANPFTEKAHMISVQSGSAKVGQWITQQRDIEADFTEYFGTSIDEIRGYAVMVDGDNGKREATARFGAIEFSARP